MQSRLSHIKRRYYANQIGLFQGSESEKASPFRYAQVSYLVCLLS